MSNLSLSIFTPLWRGQNFIRNITSDMDNWSHSVRAQGGYWQATLPLTVNVREIDDWVQDGIGRHIVCKNPALVTIWEGFVNKIDITVGRISISIGPLMDVTNRSFTTYMDRDIATGRLSGSQQMTDYYDDFDSQSKYGIIEKMLAVASADDNTAYMALRTFIEENAYPAITHGLSPRGENVSMSIECFGYVRWLDRVIYNQSTSGEVFLEEKLKSALLLDPNGFFEMRGATYTKELLANGNFEIVGGGGADIWASWTENAGTGTLTNITSDHKEGTHAASMLAGASADTYIYQDVTVEEGKCYRITFWTREIDASTLTGTHDGLANSEYLVDSTRIGKWAGARVGKPISNITDGSLGLITGVSRKANRIYATLTSGADNDWDVGDSYSVQNGWWTARFRIYDVTNATYIYSRRGVSRYGSDEWHKTTIVFYAPEGCTSIRLYLDCPSANAKTCYFDAVSFREWDAPIAEQKTLVPAYEDRNRTAWAVIQELLGYGTNEFSPYNFGVYADREARLEEVTNEPFYQASAYDPGARYRDMSGNIIDDCDVLPGKWLILTDILVGLSEPDLRKNPKTMFIDEIRYDAHSGVTINPGKFSTLKQQLARIGLQEV